MKIDEAIDWLYDVKADYGTFKYINDEYRYEAIDMAIKIMEQLKRDNECGYRGM